MKIINFITNNKNGLCLNSFLTRNNSLYRNQLFMIFVYFYCYTYYKNVISATKLA